MQEADNIRILLVSPYEGLAEAVSSVISGTEGLSVTYVSGDLGGGVEAARGVIGGGFDIIMSRGGTSELLEEAFDLPVVNVEVSGYDFVRVIKLAQGNSGKAAIVGFSKITDGASVVCELLRADLEIFTVGCEDEVAAMIDTLMGEGYSVIIGDNVTVTAARRRGLHGILVTSGRESIVKALDEASRIYKYLSREKRRQTLLETALGAMYPAGLIADGGAEVLTWGGEGAPLAEAAGMAGGLSGPGHARQVLRSGGLLWLAERARLGGGAALVAARPVPWSEGALPEGITLEENASVETPFSVFSANDELFRSAAERAKSLASADVPLFIWGDTGTGKTSLACAVHMSGKQKSGVFLTADCAAVSDGGWQALLMGEESVLKLLPAGSLFLKNVEDIPEKWAGRLLACLDGNGKAYGWRVLASSVLSPESLRLKSEYPPLARRLTAFSVRLPALSERRQAIGDISSLMISEANSRYGREIVALEPEALSLLTQHPWDGNIGELREVITELVMTSRSPYIGPEAAKAVLERRRYSAPPAEISIAQGKSLEEIESDIIRRVICEEGGNQSRAAKRLGISRSTMWRKIRGEG